MSQAGNSLADRMKSYESEFKMLARVPKVIRLDGRAFGSFLKDIKDSFDPHVITALTSSAKTLMEDIGGTARIAYIQSDECSIALNDHLDINTQAWFGNNVQKIASISSSIFTKHFSINYTKDNLTKHAYFDSRVTALPSLVELKNYFVWRQQDAVRNSINKYARTIFSHKELEGATCETVLGMCRKEGSPWENLDLWKQRGVCIIRDDAGKFKIDWNIPIFTTENINYIDAQYTQIT